MEGEAGKTAGDRQAGVHLSQEFVDKLIAELKQMEDERNKRFYQLDARVRALESDVEAMFERHLSRRLGLDQRPGIGGNAEQEDPLYRLRRLVRR